MCEAEQLSFTDNINSDFEMLQSRKILIADKIINICDKITVQNNISYKIFNVECSVLGDGTPELHKHNVSIAISSYVGMHIYLQKKIYRIEVLRNIGKYVELPDEVKFGTMKSYPNSFVIDFKNTDDTFYNVCEIIINEFLNRYIPSERFGCCGKYEICSNEKKCVHHDKFYAKACMYKQNLESGRIFYGKNRNVD